MPNWWTRSSRRTSETKKHKIWREDDAWCSRCSDGSEHRYAPNRYGWQSAIHDALCCYEYEHGRWPKDLRD
jgi:hypothetical protein